jgi:hypothetical protein
MQVAESPPIDHSLNASAPDERARGWGIEVGPDGELRQGPEPDSPSPDDEASAPYPWSRQASQSPPDAP